MKATAAPPRPADVRAASPRRRTRLRALPGSGNATALIGGTIVTVTILVALLAPLIAPDDPLATNPSSIGLGPFSHGHLLGTDEVGRDILSRLMYGTRLALLVAVVPTLVALAIGGCLGLLSGYVGGWLDSTLMRVFDVMFSFPGILLALGIGVALGPGITSMVIAMVVVTVPEFGRIVRGNVIALRQEQYVEAMRRPRIQPSAHRLPPHHPEPARRRGRLRHPPDRPQRHPQLQPRLPRTGRTAAHPRLGPDAQRRTRPAGDRTARRHHPRPRDRRTRRRVQPARGRHPRPPRPAQPQVPGHARQRTHPADPVEPVMNSPGDSPC